MYLSEKIKELIIEPEALIYIDGHKPSPETYEKIDKDGLMSIDSEFNLFKGVYLRERFKVTTRICS